MRLLLDQNLSYRLLARLESSFPDSTQVHRLGLEHADDRTLWQVAKDEGYVLVTKDSDFPEMTLFRGFPPQVVWLRCGNASTAVVTELILRNASSIRGFVDEQKAACLEIY